MSTKTLQLTISGTAQPICGVKYATGTVAVDGPTAIATAPGSEAFITNGVKAGMVLRTNAGKIYRIQAVLTEKTLRLAGTGFNPTVETEAAAAYKIYSLPKTNELRITPTADCFIGAGSGIATNTGFRVLANLESVFHGKNLENDDLWIIGTSGTATIYLGGADLNVF